MKNNHTLSRSVSINLALVSVLIVLLLSGCAGFGGGTSMLGASSEIDLNADVESIAAGVSRFDANTALTSSATTLQDYVDISNNNENILNSIETSVQKFKCDIQEVWEDLPAEDGPSSPSRGKLLKWAEGYETWIYYQREMQKLGSACTITSQTKSEYDNCALNNFNRAMEFERLSRSELSSAVQSIQDWRESIGVGNG
jgi:hypothetical protein